MLTENGPAGEPDRSGASTGVVCDASGSTGAGACNATSLAAVVNRWIRDHGLTPGARLTGVVAGTSRSNASRLPTLVAGTERGTRGRVKLIVGREGWLAKGNANS